ncbi:C39 family peptidase [Pseudomonas nitroreducens]|uniref:C39 family peptidase n=1 Tax=Pseudomonas nitroreducens TaxID=46680 RepID=UPI002659D905|nr:papain-like cysteine protease family protein [Pseudomonas nitroreducens]MCP1647175.1 hypothetical protein [Pseudomonas nitroreducens]MCP1685751.1 hypothetical protein [Pseudomonas nitroreducens]
MLIQVTPTPMLVQAFPTSCWISVAHYLLSYLDPNISLATLHADYYRPDPQSYLLMTGAGRPQTILNQYAFDHGYFSKGTSVTHENRNAALNIIVDSLTNGLPVIAMIRSNDIDGFGHALVITGVDAATGIIHFTDPAEAHTNGAAHAITRQVNIETFTSSFFYRYSRSYYKNVNAYCARIITLRPLNEMSLFA